MPFDPEEMRQLKRPRGLPFRIGKIGHVVLNVSNIRRSVRFYTEILGFEVSDVYPDGMVPGGMVFMRCNADHHGVALVGIMPDQSHNKELNHMAFEVGTLDEVLRARDFLRAREEAAVDGEDVARDVRGLVARKEKRRRRHFSHRAVAAERQLPGPDAPLCGRQHGLDQRRFDRARRDHVDADLAGGELHRHHLAQGDQPTLGGAISGAAQIAAQSGNGADVDDAAAFGRHPPRDRLTHQERAAEVHREDAIEELDRRIEERLVGADARAVHQHVDALEPREHGLDQPLHAGAVAHIELVAMKTGLAAARQALVGASKIRGDRLGALGREALRDGRSDATGAAGDDGDFSLRLHDALPARRESGEWVSGIPSAREDRPAI
jgi:catechol 2,3-dioxygenase-like lactoylglutathione lyase family enzyme